MDAPRVARARSVLLLALLWQVGLNLRVTSIGVSPALPVIRADLDASYAEAGLLFALPVLLMGLAALPGSRLAERLGDWGTVAVGLGLVVLGGGLRAFAPSFPAMVALTALFSAGVGLAQPCLPRLVREWFPQERASATGVYTAGLICGGIVGAGATGPLLVALGPASWRGTCLAWAALAAAGLLAWLLLGPRQGPRRAAAAGALAASKAGAGAFPGRAGAAPPAAVDAPAPPAARPPWPVWRDRTAWLITLVFLAQGIVFYQVSGWMPTYYQELGLPLEQAGAPLAVFNLVQLPSALVIPVLSDRRRERRPFLIGGSLLFLVGIVGLLLAPLDALWLWPALLGGGLGCIFALALALPIDLQHPRRAAATISLMLSVGFAAILPGLLLMGALRDAFGSFTLAWSTTVAGGVVMLLLVLLLPETGRGLAGSGRPRGV